MRKNNIRSYFDTVIEPFALWLACFHKRRKHKSQQKRRDVSIGKKNCTQDLQQGILKTSGRTSSYTDRPRLASNVLTLQICRKFSFKKWLYVLYGAQTQIKFDNILNKTMNPIRLSFKVQCVLLDKFLSIFVRNADKQIFFFCKPEKATENAFTVKTERKQNCAKAQ